MPLLPRPPASLRALPRAAAAVPARAFSSGPAARRPAETKTVIPFPLALHVGTDLCSIERVHRLLRKSPARFIRRVLTPREVGELSELPPQQPPSCDSPDPGRAPANAKAVIAYLASAESLPASFLSLSLSSSPPSPSPLWAAATHLAGRFAAKEAAIKAHPHLPTLTMQSVRIARAHDHTLDRNGSGPPVAYITLPPQAAVDSPTEQIARLSISHDDAYATAVCMGFES